MDIDKYRMLLKVLEYNSFSKAAEAIGYTQSAVSHSIYALEKTLGFKVLNREGGNISLTTSGREILPYIKDVIKSQDILECATSSMLGVTSGNLYIATISSLAIKWFPQLFQEFSAYYPHIHITLSHGNYSQVEEEILNGTVDCGFLPVTNESSLEHEIILREKLCAILPPNHPLTHKKQLSLHDLKDEPFIIPGEGKNQQLDKLLKEHNCAMNVHYNISDDDVTVALVAQRLGVSILPELSYKDYLNFNVVSRELIENPIREISIAYRNPSRISPLGKIFIDFAIDFFKNENADADGSAPNTPLR